MPVGFYIIYCMSIHFDQCHFLSIDYQSCWVASIFWLTSVVKGISNIVNMCFLKINLSIFLTHIFLAYKDELYQDVFKGLWIIIFIRQHSWMILSPSSPLFLLCTKSGNLRGSSVFCHSDIIIQSLCSQKILLPLRSQRSFFWSNTQAMKSYRSLAFWWPKDE